MTDDARELEPPTRFSRSLLWQLQRASYQQQGVAAWRPGGVPNQITSNPFIAACYADVLVALLADLRRGPAPPRRPLQIIELGAGSGRFGYFLLRALADRLAGELAAARAAAAPPPFRLVMTDLAEANLDAWAAHPKLRPFLDAGLLDLAMFDAEAPGPLVLRASGDRLAPADAGGAADPVVAIANYVFDSIPYDAYRVEGGELRECLVALRAPGDRARALREPAATIHAARWRVTDAPARLDYTDPVVNDLCREYATSAHDEVILLPVASFAAIDCLARLGGGRLLVVTSDKGYRELGLRDALDDFEVATHGGCVSLSVNFHALARYVERRGGFAWPERQPYHSFYSGVLALGLDAAALPATAAAVDELARFGPGDYQSLVDCTAIEARAPSVEHLLALLRIGRWDPRTVTRFAGPLVEGVKTRARGPLDRDLAAALERVRDLHFPLPGQPDPLPALLATLFTALGRPDLAAAQPP
ncbi:MAG TPA: hypothetical protein VHE35_34080 [Kofleriaceae bacterium]|nr:hypothetical protein [Kofleriaceae bacterium]